MMEGRLTPHHTSPPTHGHHRVLSTIDTEDDAGRTALIEARERGQAAVLLALAQVIDGRRCSE